MNTVKTTIQFNNQTDLERIYRCIHKERSLIVLKMGCQKPVIEHAPHADGVSKYFIIIETMMNPSIKTLLELVWLNPNTSMQITSWMNDKALPYSISCHQNKANVRIDTHIHTIDDIRANYDMLMSYAPLIMKELKHNG